jgi:hypothetical protein
MSVLAKHVDRLHEIGRVISIFYLLLVFTLLVLVYRSFTQNSMGAVQLLVFSAWIVFQAGFLYFKEYNFKKLKNFLSEEEEARTFLPYGFVLECHDEIPMDHRPQGYYLYFIPSTTNGNDNSDLSPPELSCQRGYLRVQVVKGGLCSWNTSPALPFYDYLPDGMVSVSLADWSEFWSKMDMVSSTAMSSIFRLQLIVWFYVIWLFSMTFVNNENEIIFSVFLIVMFPLLWILYRYSGRVQAIDSDIQNVCNEYADQFEEQGVYMEFRREHNWTALSYLTVGGILRRFIYLFPIQPSSEP